MCAHKTSFRVGYLPLPTADTSAPRPRLSWAAPSSQARKVYRIVHDCVRTALRTLGLHRRLCIRVTSRTAGPSRHGETSSAPWQMRLEASGRRDERAVSSP